MRNSSFKFALTARLAFMVGIAAVPAASMAAQGCTPAQKNVARTAIDVATYACLLANAFKTDDAVLAVCGVEEKLAPAAKEALASMRKAGVGAPQPQCSSSAGK